MTVPALTLDALAETERLIYAHEFPVEKVAATILDLIAAVRTERTRAERLEREVTDANRRGNHYEKQFRIGSQRDPLADHVFCICDTSIECRLHPKPTDPTKEAAPMARPICPECRDGKHRNCAGTALDETTDEIVDCGCAECVEAEKVRAEVIAERNAEWWSE